MLILLELLKLLLYMKNLASPGRERLSQQSDALVMYIMLMTR